MDSFNSPRYKIYQGFYYQETCVANGSCRGVYVQAKGATYGELLGGIVDRPFIRKELEETKRCIPLVQDLGEQRSPS